MKKRGDFMCDTLYLKRERSVFFGKNSDRSPNEAHLMLRVPAREYTEGEMLRATYISVPQVEHTYACVLLKPHWIWGAEMGWNEFGLNIGNEAVFTREKREKQAGLIGMDLLRLALERCRSAKEALELITAMIGEYGQGGNCGFHKAFYYDNAFLISDEQEAYVLETAGRSWAVKKAGEVETISNCFGLRTDYEDASAGVTGDFRKAHQNHLVTAVAGAEKRRAASRAVLSGAGEPFALMMKALKSHESEAVDIHTSSTASVCMHAGNLFGDQTTGSYCGEINRLYFVTGSSFPCLSIYKPLSPAAGVLPSDEKETLQYWLKRELLHRHLMSGNIDEADYLKQAAGLQRKFLASALAARDTSGLEAVSAACFAEEEAFVEAFLKEAGGKKINVPGQTYFCRYWRKKNEELAREYALSI